MRDSSKSRSASGSIESCLEISLRSEASHIRASDGRDIAFDRAILIINNCCSAEVIDLVPHAVLGQESGTVQDVSGALAGAAVSLPAGGSVRWDVFDRLLPAHSGTASRVHMFGYRAVLTWIFELSVWADVHVAGAVQPEQTPVSRWTLQWSVPDQAAGAVVLKIEKKTA